MNKLKQLLGNPKLRSVIVVLILGITVVVFVRFFTQHPQYIKSLRHIKLWQVLAIMGLNLGAILSLVFVYTFTLEMCGKRIPLKEQFLLTAYSSIANFFGPLQSGPGVRTVYLKTKYKVRMRDYIFATLVYYAIFALISVLFLVGGSRPWWQALLAVLLTGLVCYVVIQFFISRSAKKGEKAQLTFNRKIMVGLTLATLAQICFMAGYYFVELSVVKSNASLRQTIIYAGAANLAIFVSLTPDAIGFRESFLILSKRLHKISTPAILSANLIDRAVYPIFLIILFVITFGFHAKERFTKPASSTK